MPPEPSCGADLAINPVSVSIFRELLGEIFLQEVDWHRVVKRCNRNLCLGITVACLYTKRLLPGKFGQTGALK